MEIDPLPRSSKVQIYIASYGIEKKFIVFILIGLLLLSNFLHPNINNFGYEMGQSSKAISIVKYSKAPRHLFYGAVSIISTILPESIFNLANSSVLKKYDILNYHTIFKRFIIITWYNSKYF